MRVIFMGTPAFALPTLHALIASNNHEVVAVYSQPPRPAGRGQKLTPSPVHQLAEAHGIAVHTPISLKSPEAQAVFVEHRADVAVVAAYGLLLPQAILDAPVRGCINIHPSDLPRWRGAAPIQRTLMAGDINTACCIMQMNAGLDTGDILLREAYPIPPDMDAGGLHNAMAELGATLTLRVLNAPEWPTPTKQSEQGVTYAAKLTKADCALDWALPAQSLQHQIRGLSPSMGGVTILAGEPLKIFVASLGEGDASKPAGMLLDDALRINCGDGESLTPTLVQRAGKPRLSTQAFLQGNPVTQGTLLEKPQ